MVQVIQIHFCGNATCTLQVRLGGKIGGFIGGDIFGMGIATVARRGDRRGCWVVGGGCFLSPI